MESSFFILAVLAIVTHNSLATMTPTQSKIMTDYSEIEASHETADLECQKAVDVIFDCLESLANIVPGNKNPPKGSSCATETSKAKVLTAMIAYANVTLRAIQIINAEDYSGISAARKVGAGEIQTLVVDMYKGIQLTQDKKSSKTSAKIEALGNEMIARGSRINDIIYGAFQYHKTTMLEIGAAIQRTQKKSDSQFGLYIRSVYTGIRALLGAISSGHQGGSGSALVAIKSARNRASSALKADNVIKYGFIRNLFLALSIIQTGIKTDFSAIHAIQIAEMSDHQQATHSIVTTGQGGPTEVAPQIENGMIPISEALRAGQEVSLTNIKMAVSIIFGTMFHVFEQVTSGNQDFYEGDWSETGIAKKREFIACKTAIESYFHTTVIVQPQAASVVAKIRPATWSQLFEVVRGIKNGTDLLKLKTCSAIPAEIEAIERKTIYAAVVIAEKTYIPIKYGHESHTSIGSTVDRAREKTVSLIINIFQIIFKTLKKLLTQVSPGYHIESEDCSSSINAFENETQVLFAEAVNITHRTIQSLTEVSKPSQMENGMVAICEALQADQEVSLTNVEMAVSIIFKTMIHVFEQVTSGNRDFDEGDWSATAIAKKREFIALKTAIESYFDANEIVQPKAASVAESIRPALYSQLMEVDRGIKKGTDLLKSENCTEIPAKIEAIERRTIHAGVVVAEKIYIPIKYGHQSDTIIGAAIDRAREKAVFLLINIYQIIFKALRIFLAQIFPEYHIEGEDCSSVEAFENEAQVLFAEAVNITHGVIQSLAKASCNHDVDTTSDSCGI